MRPLTKKIETWWVALGRAEDQLPDNTAPLRVLGSLNTAYTMSATNATNASNNPDTDDSVRVPVILPTAAHKSHFQMKSLSLEADKRIKQTTQAITSVDQTKLKVRAEEEFDFKVKGAVDSKPAESSKAYKKSKPMKLTDPSFFASASIDAAIVHNATNATRAQPASDGFTWRNRSAK